jgi:hypothetical protein
MLFDLFVSQSSAYGSHVDSLVNIECVFRARNPKKKDVIFQMLLPGPSQQVDPYGK